MNPQPTLAQDDINALLAQEHNCASTLCDILGAEREALANNQVELLHDLSERKQQLAAELEQLSKQRSDWLNSHGVDGSTEALDSFFTTAGEETKLGWEKLLAQLEECQKMNRLNGSIVKQLQRNIRDALSLLQGQTETTDLYDQSGNTNSGTANSILTRA